MSVQTEEAVLDITIRDGAAEASIKELTDQVKYLTDALSKMHREDNPALYQSRINQLIAIKEELKEQRAELNLNTEAISKFQAAINRATDVSAIGARVVNMLSRQIIGLGVSMLSATIGAKAIEALATWISNLDIFSGRLDKAVQSWRAWSEVMTEGNKSAGKGLAELEVLNHAAQDVNLTEKERIAAAEKMKELWPDKLKGLSDEAIMNGKVKTAIDEVTASIEKQAIAEAGLKKITEIESLILDLKTLSDKINYAKAHQTSRITQDIITGSVGGSAETGGGTGTLDVNTVANQKKQIKNATDKQQADIKAQLAVLENTKKVIEDNIGTGGLAKAAEGKGKKEHNDKELNARKKFLAESKALTEQFDEFSGNETAARLAKDDKEVQDLKNKFDREILKEQDFLDKNKDNVYRNDAEMQKHRDQIAALEVQKKKDVDELLLKQQQEAEKKALEEELKAAETRIKAVKDQGLADLDKGEEKAIGGITATDPKAQENQRYTIQQIFAQKRYELEEKFLNMQKELYTAYGKDTSDTDKKIADESIKEDLRAAKEKQHIAEQAKTATRELQKLEMDNLTQGAQFLEGVLDKKSALYAAALIVDKAVAIARVIMDTQVSIAAYAAANAGIPIIGEALIAEYTAAAYISEGESIASIVAGAAAALGGGAKAAKGGVFDGSSHDQGGLNVFDSRTGRHVANVEGGEPWMVLSKETQKNNGALINQLLFNSMYRNGATVDTGAVSKGIQVARTGAVFNNAAFPQSGSPANNNTGNSQGTNTDMAETNRLLAGLHDKFDDWSKKPWEFNNRAFEIYQDQIGATRNAANAKSS